MNSSSIRRYLRSYKIYGRISTSVSYAFASAITGRDSFDQIKILEALTILGQEAENLTCVYCDQPAQGWDHLVAVVKDGKDFGPGHRIRNLVPCCRDCNDKKGNRSFEDWLTERRFPRWEEKIECLRRYLAEEPSSPTAQESSEQQATNAKYWAIRDRIFGLMRDADAIAERIHALRSGGDGGEPPGSTRRKVRAIGAAAYNPAPGTIGWWAVRRLAQKWPADRILADIKERFPGAQTGNASLAWYRTRVKRMSPEELARFTSI